jgi:hypothetical protein
MDYFNETWLHGKYDNGEINTRLPYVAVNDPDFFCQGEDASEIINEIYRFWIINNVTQEEAFENWINLYL